MKIVGVESALLCVPLEEPISLGSHGRVTDFWHVLVRLKTDEGAEGVGYAFSASQALMVAVKTLVEELGPLVLGADPLSPWGRAQRLWGAAGRLGGTGPVTYAIAAIDVALWDLLGQVLERPLHRLLGSTRDAVPVYASHGLWRPLTPEALARNAQAHVAAGFRAMKLRLGAEASEERELERVRAVREAVGPEVNLLVDVNWNWSPPQAIRIGRKLEAYNVFWLEDPVPAEDLEGLAQVAAALDLPVVAGETYSTKFALRELVARRAVDILMIDLMRVGGISEWLKVAALAETFNLPVVPHLVPEVHCHLVAALPHALTVEYMIWSFGLLAERPKVQDGLLLLPQKPGLGLELDQEVLRRCRVA